MSEERWATFQRKLEEEHDWPCRYTFKVVSPAPHVERVRELLDRPEDSRPEHSRRESKTGKYVSLTVEWTAEHAAEVVGVYRSVSVVEGVILL